MRVTDALLQLNEILKTHGDVRIVSHANDENFDPVLFQVRVADEHDVTDCVKVGDKYLDMTI